jgi:transcriptional regulator with XRE-family HTH domain
MSESSTSTFKDGPLEELPLSVLLFNAAMSQGIALSEFAKQLGIGPLSLRQFISGQTQRPRSRTLEVLAEALDMSVDEVRRRSSLRPTSAPSFADWLKEHMNGSFSRARLTRETRISDGALRNYLSGQTLPDSDQAQRLASILEVDPLELAKVLVADQTERSGGETVPPEPDDIEGNGTAPAGDSTDGLLSETGLDEAGLEGRVGPGSRASLASASTSEEQLLLLWRQLHPQARRATLIYIAGLLAEG